MTDYNFARKIADAIVEIHNEKYEALKKAGYGILWKPFWVGGKTGKGS